MLVVQSSGPQLPSPASPPSEHRAARYSIRIVIQRVVEPGKKTYRVVAYGGRQALGHSDFHSLEHLLDVLHSAVPGFDATQFAAANSPDEISSIIFADEVELDDSQLATLGVS